MRPSERNVQETDIICERNVQGMDITSKKNVQGTDITSERYRERKLHVREIYRGQIHNLLQDYTDGHYIKLFAEQLTRTFEVLVVVCYA